MSRRGLSVGEHAQYPTAFRGLLRRDVTQPEPCNSNDAVPLALPVKRFHEMCQRAGPTLPSGILQKGPLEHSSGSRQVFLVEIGRSQSNEGVLAKTFRHALTQEQLIQLDRLREKSEAPMGFGEIQQNSTTGIEFVGGRA